MTLGNLRSEADENRFILRAELRRGEEVAVSYASDVTSDSAFVATELAMQAGEAVSLRLSFPRLLDPVDLDARVDEVCEPSGPGAPPGVRLRFAPDARLSGLLDRATGAGRPAKTRACRILLVEDNGFIRDVFEYGLRVFFQARGAYTVAHADTVEVAWQRLAETSYDIAIVDYYLPAETGAALIERMRRDARLADVPIVAVSVGGRDAREASLAAGADLFLDKPLVFRDLFNTLRVLALPEAPDPGGKKTILVFDDSPMVLELTRAALEAAGFAVAVAEDLATFEQHRGTLDPDLILVDVQMPEAFGDDVVLTLREGHGVQVPILLVSSLDETELAKRAARARAAGYIPKKAGMMELVRRCKEVLEVTA